MTTQPTFKSAHPYQTDVLALPIADISIASDWYCKHFGMSEIRRSNGPVPSVILERDGTQIGFVVNGGDASQDGAAILVSDIHELRREFVENGLEIGDIRTDERNVVNHIPSFSSSPRTAFAITSMSPKTSDNNWINRSRACGHTGTSRG